MTNEIATPLLNIIVLTPDEKVITWLIPDIAEIKEINEVDTVRKIEITYPIENKRVEYDSPWYNQGNKIFIPSIFGLTNCLYVINTEYNLDYWDENKVTVQAEEVLTEFNYQMVGIYSNNAIPITQAKLIEWFGRFYTIGTIEALASNKNSINELGTVTLMKLLRTIEETTERKFVTEYTYTNNKIKRKLSLVKETTLRQTAGTEYLDLNYNLDSLELTIDESKTYSAMAPELKINEQLGTTPADYVNANNIQVGEGVTDTETAEEVYNNWLNLSVAYREEIPMILKKDNEGNVTVQSTWYAPFQKKEGQLYIEYVGWSSSSYNYIQPPDVDNVSTKDKIINPIPKVGTVQTSETLPYAIYNTLANSLLEKLNPKFELKLKVSDIVQILGLENLGYNIYETLYVKIPGFDYWVPAYITKTTKNPHLPGKDEITVETDVSGTHLRQETMILEDNQTIQRGATNPQHGGVLTTVDKEVISDELVTINIRLVEAYSLIGDNTALIHEWKPKDGDIVYFSKSEILSLEENLRHDLIKNKSYENQYLMTDINGVVYSVPLSWCFGIYYAYIQHYITTDNPLGTGNWIDNLPVEYQTNYKSLLSTKPKLSYFAQAYVGYINERREYLTNLGFPNNNWKFVCSSEIQNGPTCVANAVAQVCAFNFMYKTESDILKMFGKSNSAGIKRSEIKTIVIPTLQKLGFQTEIVEFTQENVRKYIQYRTPALLFCNAQKVGYTQADANVGHAIVAYFWYSKNSNFKVSYFDSNKPIYNPLRINSYNTQSLDMSWEDIRSAVTYNPYNTGNTSKDDNDKRYMVVISRTVSQIPDNFVSKHIPAAVTSENNPKVVSYEFTRTEIEHVLSNIIRTWNRDYWNKEFDIRAVDGKTYQMNILWINALALAYMYYYHNHWNSLSEYDARVKTGGNSDSLAYFNYLNQKQYFLTYGNPVFPDRDRANEYILSCILFNLGVLRPPKNIFDGTGYAYNQRLTFSEWANAVKKYIPDIHYEVLTYNSDNLSRYLKEDFGSLILIFSDKAEVEHDVHVIYTQPYYPILLYSLSDNRLNHFHIFCSDFTPNGANKPWDYKGYAVNPLPSRPTLTNAAGDEYNTKMLYLELPKIGTGNASTTNPSIIRSLFVRMDATVNSSTVTTWLNNGITDVYVQCRVSTNDTAKFRDVVNLCRNTSIKVHSWVICFDTNNGFDVSTNRQNEVLNFIRNTMKISGCGGICLDYVRYSGTKANVDSTVITNFVKNTYNMIKQYNPAIELSACVFAEQAGTKTYYGQDYETLSAYLDVELIMAYRYDYNSSREWISTVTRYAVTRATKCKVVTVVTTYNKAGAILSKSELELDIMAGFAGGSKGYSLFRYGLINSYPEISSVSN